MNMTKKNWLLVSIAAFVCILLVLGISELVDYATGMKPGETFGPEETVVVDGQAIRYHARISTDAYPAGTPVGDWIAGCMASDRDDQLDVYVLRYAAVSGDVTTYTYLVYANGTTTDTAAPILFEGETRGYRVDLSWTEPTEQGYTLSRVEFSLPSAEEPPRLRVMVDGDALGALVTVSDTPIPAAN